MISVLKTWIGRLIVFSFFFIAVDCFAVNRTWIGGTGVWNVAGNWAPAGVPGVADVAIFDGTSTMACNINTTVTVLGIQVNNTYTGTITQNAFAINVGTSGANFSGGIFTGGSEPITITNGNLTIANNFTSTSKSLTMVSGATNNYNFTGTINPNGGRFVFNGNVNFSGIAHILNKLTLYGNLDLGGQTITINDSLVYTGGNSVEVNNGTLVLKGDLLIGNTSGAGLGGTGTINFNGAVNQNASCPSTAQGRIPNVIMNKTGGNLVVSGYIRISGNYTYTAGTITGSGYLSFFNGNTFNGVANSMPNMILYSGNYNFTVDVTVSDTLWLANSGNTINFNGNNLIVSGNMRIENLSTGGGFGTATVQIVGATNKVCLTSSPCGTGLLPNVIFNKPGGSMTIIQLTTNGAVSIRGTWTYVAGNIIGTGFLCFSSANTIGGPAQNFTNVGFTNGIYPINSPITVSDTLLIGGSGNPVVLTNGTITLNGSILIKNDNTTTQCPLSPANIDIVGTGNQSIISQTIPNAGRLPNININKASGTLSLVGDISVAGDWAYVQGTVDPLTSNVIFSCPNKFIDCQGTSLTMSFYKATLGSTDFRTLNGDMGILNQLSLQDGYIVMNTYDIEIKTAATTGIITNTGHLFSETDGTAGYGMVKWRIGNTAAGTYTVPFRVTFSSYIPFTFTIQTAGVQTTNGSISVGTYGTNWVPTPNNRPLPTGVTNLLNLIGSENAAKEVDRFWILTSENYSTQPVTNLTFTYRETEWNTASNSLNESNLKAHQYNFGSNQWGFPPAGTVNTAANTVTTNGINTYTPFTLVDNTPPDLIVTASDTTVCVGQTITFTESSPTPPNSWSWSFQGGTPSTGTGNPVNVTYNTTGTYSVTVTGTYANGSVTTTKTNYIVVTNGPTVTPSSTNVSCFGGNNGTITLAVSGGVTPYTFAWSDGPATTQNRTGLAPNTYTVTVSDAAGCSITASRTITQPSSAVSVSASVTTAITCFGGNGVITASGSGGTPGPGYQYAICSGAGCSSYGTNQTGTTFSVTAGTYRVRVTDANGCTAVTADIVVTEPSALTAGGSVTTAITCFGGNGVITASGSGGTPGPGYQYAICSGAGCSSYGTNQTGTTFSVTAGTYRVRVTDANSCTAVTADIVVSQPSLLSLSTQETNVSCNGGNNGAVNLTVSGGTAGYTYAWDNGATTEDISNLTAGIYCVIVTDANSCTATRCDTVTEPATAVSVTSVNTDISCNGGSDGAIDIIVTGGTPSYTFIWTNGATTEDLTNLPAGIYCVTATDANGCTATVCDTVAEPTPIDITKVIGNVSCNGLSDANIDITVTGGTPGPGYSYLWSYNAQTTEDLAGIPAGQYIVTVTDSRNCTDTAIAVVTEPTAVILSTANTNVNCNGGSNGSVTLTVSGGTSPYTFNWDNGATTQDITGLAAGVYCVTVYDAFQCSATICDTITEPSALSLSTVPTDVNCFGGNDGAVDLTVTGGTSGYTYLWDNGATTEDINNLIAGTYCITVTDANNCTATICETVNEPATAVTIGIQHTDISCNGGSDGTIDITPSGGTPGYTFNWSNGATTQNLTNLTAGIYCVIVTDANGCNASVCDTVVEPTAISITKAVTNVSCNGLSDGAVDITVTGGTTGYTYLWSYNAQTTEDLTGIPAGIYCVTVTDANGCTASTCDTVTEPTAIILSITSTEVKCNGGSDGAVDLTISGGTGPYTFAWDNGATTEDLSNIPAGIYCVVATDTNNCTATICDTITEPAQPLDVTAVLDNDISCYNANDAQITATATGGTPTYTYSINGSPFFPTNVSPPLPAGTYIIVAKDTNGCLDTIPQPIVVTNPPELFGTSTLDNDISCNNANDAQITCLASGGVGPYTFTDGNTSNATGVFAGLSGGTYCITVTDATGCSVVANCITVTNPAVLTVSLVLDNDISCNNADDAQLTATGNGGTTPYQYSITGPNGPFQSSGIFSNLSAGSYQVDIRDTNGCVAVSNSIAVTNPPLLVASATHTDVNCFGGNDGTATASAVGGTVAGTYNYLWSPSNQTTQTATSLTAGTYVVAITDDNGCVDTASVIVSEPATAVSAVAVVDSNVSCFGGNDAAATVTASGGTIAGNYIYVWSQNTGNQSTATASNLTAGKYFVTVIDDNGCEAVDSVTVTEPSLLTATVQLDSNAYCNNNGHGQLTANPSGGTSPYTYTWSDTNSQTTQTAFDISAGNYTVSIVDANGCSVQRSAQVSERPGPVVSGFTIVRSTCHNSNGVITVNATTSDTPLSYTWSHNPNLNGPVASGLPQGSYSVTITDLATCDTSVNFSFIDIPGPQITASFSKDAYCDREDGLAGITVTSGTPPFTYSWSHSVFETDSISDNLDPGSYTVTITDANQCDTTASFVITNVPAPESRIDQTSPVTIVKGQETLLSVTLISAPDSVIYEWIPSSSIRCFLSQNSCDSVKARPFESTIYQVKITDVVTGCDTYDTITVIVRDGDKMFIPNAITPNGDGVNDVWKIRELTELPDNEVIIFNRWGDEVFSAKPYLNDWGGTYNGKPLPAGTYYYVLKINALEQVLDGNITIIK
jgi:gliding motility-associated-like protein